MYKLLIAILLILPGGFLLAPALMLWVRRTRRGQQKISTPQQLTAATAEAAKH